MKKIIALFVVSMLLFMLLFATSCAKANEPTTLPTTTEKPSTSTAVSYQDMFIDWSLFENASALVEEATLVVVGTIKDVSFAVVDSSTAEPPTEESEPLRLHLNSYYTVDVLQVFKGDVGSSLELAMDGGIKDFKVEEQLAALGDLAEKGIPIAVDVPELNIGETYLLLMKQNLPHAAYPYYPAQSIYNLSVESPLTQHPNMTAKDIILTFGEDKWQDFWAQWQAEHPDYQELTTTTIYD
ncbi:MAG: hypothetical protein LBB67_03360 [Oscillospiraceae bacterium]|nr:hypothetical protein [Oscillospiraceae bacterium]